MAERTKRPVSTQLPARAARELHEAIAELARRERRSRTQVVVILLEEGLHHRGLWPRTAATAATAADENP